MYEIKIKKRIEEVTGLKEAKLTVPPPTFKGDLSTNAAMTAGMDPRKLSRALLSMKEVDEVTTAGPGFVNIILKPEAYCNELSQILAGAENYGSATGKGTVLFEMVSSNPTGPLHIGHGRGAAIGDSLARIFNKTGYDVYREYYVNDSGNQMRLLGESVSRVSRGLKPPEEGYRGAYIEEIAENLPPSDDIAAAAGEKILRGHIKVLEKFKVKYDSFVRESHFDKTGSINNHIDKMKKRNLTYLKKGALWFKSTRFGDDSDRVLVKKDGSYTYFAADCAYHSHKASRFPFLVNIWGADHHGYVPRLKAFWESFGYAENKKLEIVLYQLVDLLRGGRKVSMSTRAGEFVTLDEVIKEVGSDAARFFMLMRSSDAPLEFDLELAKEESSKNPVYYVQYSHARICSVFRKKGINFNSITPDAARGAGAEERALIKLLAHYPAILEKSCRLYAPHLITDYLREVSCGFHKYYDTVRVIGSPEEKARLALLKGVKEIIKDALSLVGVSAPERM